MTSKLTALPCLLGYLAANAADTDAHHLLDLITPACIGDPAAAHLYHALQAMKGQPISRTGFQTYLISPELKLTPHQIAAHLAYFNTCQMEGSRLKTLGDATILANQIITQLEHRHIIDAAVELFKQGKYEQADSLLSDNGMDIDISGISRAAYNKLQAEQGVIDCTEIGITQLFVDRRGNDYLYISEWKRWLHWTGKRWEATNDEQACRSIIDFLRHDLMDYTGAIDDAEKQKKMFKLAHRCQSSNAVSAVRNLTSNLLGTTTNKLNKDGRLFNVQNGTLDLNTLVLHPHRKDDHLTKISNASFTAAPLSDAEYAASNFGRFLNKIVPDPEVREYLQRFAGYSMTTSVAEEKMLLLTGGGKNGKTTLMNAIRYTLGDYAIEGDQQLLTYKPSSQKGHNSDAVASLFGSHFVGISETDAGDRLDEARVKALVSNKPINAMRKYEHSFTFHPTHKIWLDTNHKPTVKGTDEGIWRRLSVVPFDVFIPPDDRDVYLFKKLEDEVDIIFRWMLDGLRSYNKKGLTEPTAVRRAGQEYRDDSDTVRLFITDCTVKEEKQEGASVSYSDMFEAYRRWIDDNGYRFPLTMHAFNKRLVDLGFSKGRTATERGWRDCSLQQQVQQAQGAYAGRYRDDSNDDNAF